MKPIAYGVYYLISYAGISVFKVLSVKGEEFTYRLITIPKLERARFGSSTEEINGSWTYVGTFNHED